MSALTKVGEQDKEGVVLIAANVHIAADATQ